MFLPKSASLKHGTNFHRTCLKLCSCARKNSACVRKVYPCARYNRLCGRKNVLSISLSNNTAEKVRFPVESQYGRLTLRPQERPLSPQG